MGERSSRQAPMARLAAAALAAVLLAGFGSGGRLFAPEARLWQRWTAHDETADRRIDFGAWDALLKRYVIVSPEGHNRVRYRDFSETDRSRLDAFISTSARIAISGFPRREQLAYWVNLYNALTVQVVLDRYPVASIRDIDISPGLFSSGPWGRKLVRVEGEPVSLDDIEHRILRPGWRDPRIHYALNCASIGCPDLQPFAFAGADIDRQLDQAARGYVNGPRGVSIDGQKVTVSSIYDWFIADFGGSEAGVIAHLLRYARPRLARRLKAIGRLDKTAYDWRLNDG